MTPPTPTPPDHLWSREYLTTLLKTGLISGEPRFVRQTALTWLAAYPGDLPVKFLQAQALRAEGHPRQAVSILESLTKTDPEFAAAQDLLSETSLELGLEGQAISQGCAVALSDPGQNPRPKDIHPKTPRWGYALAKTRQALAKGSLSEAESGIQKILGVAADTPLSAVTHLQVLLAQKSTPQHAIRNLAQHYHHRWPQCVQFALILAETWMDNGAADQAVALLHWAASQDVTGQVVTRLWGAQHPYRSLWPADLKVVIETQIPASVAGILGWNLLGGGHPHPQPLSLRERGEQPETGISEEVEISSEVGPISVNGGHPKTRSEPPEESGGSEASYHPEKEEGASESSQSASPETEKLKSVQAELDKVARRMKRPDLAQADGRFPVYVVFTTQQGLERKYGADTAGILDHALRKLVRTLRKRLKWGAILVYADDPASMAQYGLQPAPASDAWKLKLALTDLDAALGKKGAKIGAVLIIGGPEVVPFHHLPNPTDDADVDVPSDNPYATRDENYFIPEWPVGRLPGGVGKDPGLMISALRGMITRHAIAPKKSKSWLTQWWEWLSAFWPRRRKLDHASFGMSTEAWQDASMSIYRIIGEPRDLVTSPPAEIPASGLPVTNLGYFNLHGVSDSAEWFGQRDPIEGADGPDYPTALHPRSVQNSGKAPQVVFSEACFGNNIFKKSVEEALALKFLSAGSQAVIGSTVISYGSVSPPLNAADLLGKSFWRFLKQGRPAGEALRRAKIFLATEMHKRQGYLDGEDQKTLISFVLYGDPLTQIADLPVRVTPKIADQFVQAPTEIKTVCDRAAAWPVADRAPLMTSTGLSRETRAAFCKKARACEKPST